MRTNITTSIDPVVHQLARDNSISWAEALEFGIKFLVAEKDGVDYPDNKLLNRIAKLQGLIAEVTQSKEEGPKKTAEEDLKEVFEGVVV